MKTPLAAVEDMLRAVIDRDLDAVLDAFSGAPDAYVFPEGPRWTTRGGDRIEQGWRAYFEAPVGVDAYRWAEGPHVFESDTLGQVTGVLDYDVHGDGREGRLRMRMTWLLRREPERSAGGAEEAGPAPRGESASHRERDRWRVVHEHGSQPLTDPYGAGDWWPDGARPLGAET